MARASCSVSTNLLPRFAGRSTGVSVEFVQMPCRLGCPSGVRGARYSAASVVEATDAKRPISGRLARKRIIEQLPKKNGQYTNRASGGSALLTPYLRQFVTYSGAVVS